MLTEIDPGDLKALGMRDSGSATFQRLQAAYSEFQVHANAHARTSDAWLCFSNVPSPAASCFC
jgi:hypothetical protein